MNNLCKLLLMAILILASCTDGKEPQFDTFYIYKNKLANKVSIEFYRKNREKKVSNITDSLVMPYRDGLYSFGPEYNDSIVIIFADNKKVIFRAKDSNSSSWSLNATNTSSYKRTEHIKDPLTTYKYTYMIDNKIYELAK